ncbi:MAG: hypothetical protein J2P43_03945, partial [Candidatus Dormibacteraeota bacterium]|nr:hypothetical protein [Candidatus Dormibacteraeota bacterium]
ELHDTVSSTLTTLLIQIQQLKLREEEPSETAGSCPTKAEVCAELEAFQAAARPALHHARRLVRELRRSGGSPSPRSSPPFGECWIGSKSAPASRAR